MSCVAYCSLTPSIDMHAGVSQLTFPSPSLLAVENSAAGGKDGLGQLEDSA
jgi:hypothetical protein